MRATWLLLTVLSCRTSLMACAGPTQSPVVDNRSDIAYYARVGGVSGDAATARVVELPPGVRTSLERHEGVENAIHDGRGDPGWFVHRDRLLDG